MGALNWIFGIKERIERYTREKANFRSPKAMSKRGYMKLREVIEQNWENRGAESPQQVLLSEEQLPHFKT